MSVAGDAAGRPHLAAVLTLLDSYFAAINRHDFPAYRRLFIPAIQHGLQHFGAGYASIVDSAATLTGLTVTGPEGLAARVTFTGHQKPAASPNHAACDHWHITCSSSTGPADTRSGGPGLASHRRCRPAADLLIHGLIRAGRRPDTPPGVHPADARAGQLPSCVRRAAGSGHRVSGVLNYFAGS